MLAGQLLLQGLIPDGHKLLHLSGIKGTGIRGQPASCRGVTKICAYGPKCSGGRTEGGWGKGEVGRPSTPTIGTEGELGLVLAAMQWKGGVCLH